ncbi:helix-turn-helix domain-containing protein [Dactylosporangium sp. CA-092794]|uniref:helix-turn-helix domain-containing protein n=1 Tax=Dactylosporangium sp. CA-092794 TaxID=3239929 RepID=UPI003D93165B
MALHTELGEFLQSRRSRLRPEDVGLPTYDERRRVPGLRREELAQLAGVSASYYTRLEQGQSLNASVEVLDALARALRLDEHERMYLRDLAVAKTREPDVTAEAEHPTASMRSLLRAMGGVPAVLTGRRCDILAWNTMGHALFAGHVTIDAPERPQQRPNIARLIFTDAHTRSLYADWQSKAKSVVEHLRLMAGRYPCDPLLAALIGELAMQSQDFATLWADHRVHACDTATYELHHPLVGGLTITQQSLTATAAPDQFLAVATTEPDSPSEAALLLLAQLAA